MTHLWTTAEVAAYHKVHPQTVREWHRSGLLKASHKFRSQWVFDIETAKALVKPKRGYPAYSAKPLAIGFVEPAPAVRCLEDELSVIPDPPWAKAALAFLHRGPAKASAVAQGIGRTLHDVEAWLDLSAFARRHVQRIPGRGHTPTFKLLRNPTQDAVPE